MLIIAKLRLRLFVIIALFLTAVILAHSPVSQAVTATAQVSGVYLEDGVPGGIPIENGDTVDMGFVQAGVSGDYPLVLHNQSDSTVTIMAVTGSSYPGIYTDFAESLPMEVAPHTDRLLRLFCFSPSVTTLNVSLSISTSARDFNFNVVCTVLDGSPDIQVTDVSTGTEVLAGDTANLGTTGVGVPIDRTFRIENVGTGVVGDFNFDPMPTGLTYTTDISPSGLGCTPGYLPGGRLGPGECFDLILTCASSAVRTVAGLVPINSSDPDENPFTFNATCDVVDGAPTETATVTTTPTLTPTNTATIQPPGPEISVIDWNGVSLQSGGTLDMGEPTEPMIIDRILTLLNAGDEPLNFGNSSIIGSGGISPISHFGVYDTTHLNPGETFPMRLLCSPLTPGAYTALLTIPSNDADEPTFTLTVVCTIPPTPTPTVTATNTATDTPTATETATAIATDIPTSTPSVTPTPSSNLGCAGPTAVDNGNALRYLIETIANSNGQDDTITLQAGCVYDVSGTGDGGAGTLGILPDVGRSLTIIGNGATISGGNAVRVFHVMRSATLHLNDVVIQDGSSSANNGGGILNEGTLTVTNSTLSDNDARQGGAIFNDYLSAVTITNSIFLNNNASLSGSGGGIYNNNDATGTFTGGTVTVTNSTFSGNSDGIFNASTVTVTNSTFFENGRGIYNQDTLMVTNSTFFNSLNGGSNGSGIYNAGVAEVGNSILFYTGGSACAGALVHTAPNLGCGGSVVGDPMLGALTSSAAYFTLLPGSAAIDAGDNSLCPSTDQRGAARPMDGDGDGTATCDLGAFEADAVFVTNTPITTFTPTPTDTPTATATATEAPTDVPTATATSTAAPTDTPTSTATDTQTPLPTEVPTNTPTDTPTTVPTDFPTNTPTDTPLPANQPPVCTSASPSDSSLRPPDGQMVPITIQGVGDPNGDPIVITITSIFQDEPVNGQRDGNTSPDGEGIGTNTAMLRAEQAGGGNGRVYHISFTADDGMGGTCSGTAQVGVRRGGGRRGEAVDDGPQFDSTQT